jgi:dTDP-4-amino-4,6-dideoxygalactose transaminase
MRVPLLDLTAQYTAIQAEIRQAIDAVLESQRFVLGSNVSAFETEVARFCRAPHAVGVASGSDALLLALMAIGVSHGDEVITTPFTFFATAAAVVRLGGVPVFVDIDPTTFNLAVEQMKALSPRGPRPSSRCISMASALTWHPCSPWQESIA